MGLNQSIQVGADNAGLITNTSDANSQATYPAIYTQPIYDSHPVYLWYIPVLPVAYARGIGLCSHPI